MEKKVLSPSDPTALPFVVFPLRATATDFAPAQRTVTWYACVDCQPGGAIKSS